jgi:hypothetical protein
MSFPCCSLPCSLTLCAKHTFVLPHPPFCCSLANFAGALSNAYTTTGSFSRSAVNNQSGAQSPLAQFVCAWTVGFVLLFLTPLFQHLVSNVSKD